MSIGNLVTLGVMIMALIGAWFRFENRLNLVEDHVKLIEDREIVRIDARLGRIESERVENRDRLIRLEEQLKAMRSTLDRIAVATGAANIRAPR